MNVGRLVPSGFTMYMPMRSWLRQVISKTEQVNFTVPTGNFGNILAAYYARQIDVPVGKLICASNENNVLTDFFATVLMTRNVTSR